MVKTYLSSIVKHQVNLFFGFLVLVGLVLLYRLVDFPIFADEAIYLHWSEQIRLGQVNPFISMYDGKPPLFMWLVALATNVVSDLLLVGRLISVVSLLGFVAFVWLHIQKTSSTLWAWLSTVFLLIAPFTVFHGRLALLDMLFSALAVSAVLVWSLTEWKYKGIVTGVLLAAAFWVKTPALFLLPLPVISIILLQRNYLALKQAVMALVTALLGIIMLKVSIWFPFLFSRSEDFTFTIAELLNGQLGHIPYNLGSLAQWLWIYETPMLLLSGIVGIGWGIWKKNTMIINLFLALLLITVPLVGLGKLVAPRYYLSLGLILPLTAGYLLWQLSKMVRIGIVLLFLFVALVWNSQLLTNPYSITIPNIDKRQYLIDWSSGIGIKEASYYFQTVAQQEKIKILSEGYFGTLPDGLFIYLGTVPQWHNIEIVGVGSPDSPEFQKQVAISQTNTIFYIGNQDRIDFASRQKMELVKTYEKVDSGAPLEVFKVNKSNYDI